jgi:hypothetical protein
MIASLPAFVDPLLPLLRSFRGGGYGIALDHLPVKPQDFSRRVQALVFPVNLLTPELLEAQRLELVALVREVELLLAKN